MNSSLWNLFGTFNYTALIYAADKGHTEIVRLLLKQEGIEINNKNILKIIKSSRNSNLKSWIFYGI